MRPVYARGISQSSGKVATAATQIPQDGSLDGPVCFRARSSALPTTPRVCQSTASTQVNSNPSPGDRSRIEYTMESGAAGEDRTRATRFLRTGCLPATSPPRIGTRGRTRTDTVLFLRQTPPAIGLPEHLVDPVRIELTAACLQGTPAPLAFRPVLARSGRFELPSSVWHTERLPLS